jgi:hypothetical protein
MAKEITMNASIIAKPVKASFVLRIFLFTAAVLLLSACQPAQPSSVTVNNITLGYSAVAQNATVEDMAAVPATAGGPSWQASSQYRLLTLQGYPVAKHVYKPQIYIYPVADLASANENAAKIVTDLQALLKTRQPGNRLPFLPLINEVQALDVQVQYLDFKNGNGVRYLTQFNQGMVPINNNELIYTFQGLTSDGKYYIAALLPVTIPDLPDNSDVSAKQAEGLVDYPGYISKLVTLLDQKSADSFTPDLEKLDGLIRSLEVK